MAFNDILSGSNSFTGYYILENDDPDTIAAAFEKHCREQLRYRYRFNSYDHWSKYDYKTGRYTKVKFPDEVNLDITRFLPLCRFEKSINNSLQLSRVKKKTRSSKNDIKHSLSAIDPVYLPPEKKAPYSFDFRIDPEYAVATNNCIVDFSEMSVKQYPLSEDFYTFNYLPYDYVPGKQSKLWATTLKDVTCGDEDLMKLLQQWGGYLLLPTLKYQKFLLCIGDGANGKGVVFDTMMNALGSENISTVPLSKFGNSFQQFGMYGKMANMSNESSMIFNTQTEAAIKELSAGDKVQWEQKYRNSFSDYPTAKLMFAANEEPAFKDASDGIWRRLIYLPFQAKFEGKNIDKSLSEKLKKPEELAGILNWMIEGTFLLRKNDGFIEPEICRIAAQQCRESKDSVRRFLLSHFEPASSQHSKIPTTQVYASYQGFCNKNAIVPKGNAEFGKIFANVFRNSEKVRLRISSNDRQYVYTGIQPKQRQDL